MSTRLHVAYQPTDRVFSDQLCVFALDRDGHFAILQSRVHEVWARRHSSTLGQGLRYTPSTCLETFPFPRVDPRELAPELESAGAALERARAAVLRERQVGLTELAKLLEDDERSPDLVRLCALAEDVDRAVLHAYGWRDVAVPPYGARDDAFARSVMERLHALHLVRREQARAIT